MNRKDEYWDLISKLNDTPPELDGAVERANAKRRKHRARRWLGIPVATLGGLASAFVLLVNCSIPFALACRDVPFLRQLAAAAAFDPTLKAAVESDFYQYVGQTQEDNGVSVTIHYLVFDQSQLNVFYTLEGEDGMAYWVDLRDVGVVISWGGSGSHGISGGGMERITVSFSSGDSLPEVLDLQLELSANPNNDADGSVPVPAPERASDGPWHEDIPDAPEPDARLLFSLPIDPRFTAPAETVALDRWVALGDQRLLLVKLDIHPLSAALTIREDEENTAALRGLDYYLEDEAGNRYERGNGSLLSGGGSVDLGTRIYYMDSSHFQRTEHLTLYITQAEWLTKGRENVTLDLTTGEADHLPAWATFETVERRGEDVYIALRYQAPSGGMLGGTYYDPEGGEHSVDGMSCSSIDEDYIDYLVLEDYPWDTVRLTLMQDQFETFETPVAVVLR